MSEIRELMVEPRDRAGKGSSRAARREGLVPAVIYGDKKDPELITIKKNELIKVLNKGGFMTHVLELKVNGDAKRVLPRDLQRHPVTEAPLHVDFLRISKGATIIIEVPVHFIDNEESPGLARGGVLNVVRHTIEISAPMDDIPEGFKVSLEGLDIGDSVNVSSIELPEGVELTVTDRDYTVANIVAPSRVRTEEELEAEALAEEEAAALALLEEGEEGEVPAEGAEGAEGAPAEPKKDEEGGE